MTDPNKSSGSSPTRRSNRVSAVAAPSTDFLLENHGSIFLLRPQTTSARLWVDENIGHYNGYQPYYPTVVVEHRYIANIVEGIENDGLAVRS